jgi:uncharacterized protein RhaS with RHS repeats
MRDYDPTTGRYIQADPLGLVDGPSVYGYAGQNPGRYADPRGEEAATVGGSYSAWGVVEGGKRIGAACIAAAGVQVGVLAGLIVMATATPVGDGTLQSCDQCSAMSDDGSDGRNPDQDKKLSPAEAEKLKKGGEDPHKIKEGFGPPSRSDLYKDRRGNIYVKPKGGNGPGEPAGLNINDF